MAAKGLEDLLFGRWGSVAYLKYVNVLRQQLFGYSNFFGFVAKMCPGHTSMVLGFYYWCVSDICGDWGGKALLWGRERLTTLAWVEVVSS